MTTDEQTMMDSLSKNVTALCAAIDPKFTHGPETAKIVAHANALREAATHLCNVIDVLIGLEKSLNGGRYSDIQEYRDQLRVLLES